MFDRLAAALSFTIDRLKRWRDFFLSNTQSVVKQKENESMSDGARNVNVLKFERTNWYSILSGTRAVITCSTGSHSHGKVMESIAFQAWKSCGILEN